MWPWIRTACFLAGCLAFARVMNGGAAAWGKFRFDAHMIQHMAMMMIVPPLWVLGGTIIIIAMCWIMCASKRNLPQAAAPPFITRAKARQPARKQAVRIHGHTSPRR